MSFRAIAGKNKFLNNRSHVALKNGSLKMKSIVQGIAERLLAWRQPGLLHNPYLSGGLFVRKARGGGSGTKVGSASNRRVASGGKGHNGR